MGFYNWERSKAGSTGSAPYGGYPQTVTNYTLYSNSPEDQAPAALQYFENNIARRGQPYSTIAGTKYGSNDPDLASILTNISAQSDLSSCDPWLWRCAATWGIDDPVNFEPQFSSSTTALREEVADKAYYVPISEGYATGGIQPYELETPQTKVQITNATLRETYADPPVGQTIYGDQFRISLTLSSFNHAVQSAFRGKLNQDRLQISTLNFFADYAKYTLMMTAVDFTLRTIEIDAVTGTSSRQVFDVTWTFKYDPDAHIRRLQNVGFNYLDPIAPLYLPFVSNTGRELDKPGPLTDQGTPLLDGDGNPQNAENWQDISWRIEELADFTTIPGLGSLFTVIP